MNKKLFYAIVKIPDGEFCSLCYATPEHLYFHLIAHYPRELVLYAMDIYELDTEKFFLIKKQTQWQNIHSSTQSKFKAIHRMASILRTPIARLVIWASLFLLCALIAYLVIK